MYIFIEKHIYLWYNKYIKSAFEHFSLFIHIYINIYLQLYVFIYLSLYIYTVFKCCKYLHFYVYTYLFFYLNMYKKRFLFKKTLKTCIFNRFLAFLTPLKFRLFCFFYAGANKFTFFQLKTIQSQKNSQFERFKKDFICICLF